MRRLTIGESSAEHKLPTPKPISPEVHQGLIVFGGTADTADKGSQSQASPPAKLAAQSRDAGVSLPDPFGVEAAPDIAYTMFMPMHYERNYSYPLIVWLHGDRDDETQLQRVMPEISMRNYVAAAPRGVRVSDSPPELGWRQAPATIDYAHHAIATSIDHAMSRTNVHPRRVFLVGCGSGGTMAMRIGLREPGMFAGIVSIDGAMPQGGVPFAALSCSRKIPLLICQGRESDTYPVDLMCDDLRLIHIAGFNVTVRQYLGKTDMTSQMLRDINAWLMERVTGCPANAD